MKKTALSVLLYPIVLAIGWFATRMSERFEVSLHDIDQLEFDFE